MLFIFGHFAILPEEYQLNIPQGFPEPILQEGNPLTVSSVELGKRLFYDTVLSRDSSVSCATCHLPELAFTDGLQKSIGIKNRRVSRNAPSLANVVYQTEGILLDKGVPTLEMQIIVPVQEHSEFDFDLKLITERLKKNTMYVQLAKDAYGQEPNPYVITRAIANFERTLISGNSKYDQFINGDSTALNHSEQQGMRLFTNKLNCTACHSGFLFTDFSLKNNGLYENAYPLDSGRMRITHVEKDRDLFKVPSLRNVEVTSPYMHDGSIASLEEIIEHYSKGGQVHPNKSQFIKPFEISTSEKQDLIAFLKSLTDEEFLKKEELIINN